MGGAGEREAPSADTNNTTRKRSLAATRDTQYMLPTCL